MAMNGNPKTAGESSMVDVSWVRVERQRTNAG